MSRRASAPPPEGPHQKGEAVDSAWLAAAEYRLIGELATRSELLARLWADHDVALYDHGSETVHHDLIGDLELGFETFAFDTDSGHVVTFYYPRPDSPAIDQLRRPDGCAPGGARRKTAVPSRINIPNRPYG